MRSAISALAYIITEFVAGAVFFIAASLVLAWTGPTSAPPNDVFDVMRAPPGVLRDEATLKWYSSVWDAWAESHEQVADLAHTELGI